MRVSLRILATLAVIGVGCASAQTSCPAISFQRASNASLAGLTLIEKPDGSYTAYQTASAPPYTVAATTPDFQKQLTGCPSGQVVAGPSASSPLQAFARLGNGGYLVVSQPAGSGTLTAAVFDANLNFISQATYTGASRQSLALADLNGDGNPDIICTTLAKVNGSILSVVTVQLGNGGSSFQAPVSYSMPSSLSAGPVAVGDLNGDGVPDLAVPGYFGVVASRLSVFLGNGDGTFQPEKVVLTAPHAQILAAAIADLNGDGKADMVFTASGSLQSSSGGPPPVAVVMLGNGDGTFGAATEYAVGNGDSLAVADMDGDGKPDIVVSGLTILFGDGRGAFPRRRDYWQETTGSIILADFDGDGATDIIVGTGNPLILGGPAISVMFNRGNGVFTGAPVTLTPGWAAPDVSIANITTADFNNDGIPDLLVDWSEGFVILTGDGKGNFTPGFEQQVYAAAMAVADFNNDGIPDVAVATPCCVVATPLALEIYAGQGDGSFRPPISSPSIRGVASMAAADFNGDGKQDLAVIVSTFQGGADDEVDVFRGDGQGGFSAPVSLPAGPWPAAIGVGDFNGDGKPDFVVASTGGQTGTPNIQFFFGKGDGSFSSPGPLTEAPSSSIGPRALVIADLNRDGKLDVAFPGSDGTLIVGLGHADGTFVWSHGPALSGGQLSAADLNGDGALDLIAIGGEPQYLLGNGDGSFQPGVALADSAAARFWDQGVAVADLNGDGRPDIVSAAYPTGVATFLNISQWPMAIVSAASFASGPLAAESLASAFGGGLAPEAIPAAFVPLPTSLGGTTVSVVDSTGAVRGAPLFYVSPKQVNFQVPAGTAAGPASVYITSSVGGSTTVGTGSTSITATSPALFSADESGTGVAAAVVTVISNGVQTGSPVFSCTFIPWICVPQPINLGGPNDQAVLALYGSGIRGRSSLADVACMIGAMPAQVLYAGPQGLVPGIDEVDVVIPRALAGSGAQSLVVSVGGRHSNSLLISLQ
jgi:uncharacterized protein (TIGR03437 family)